MKKEQQRREAHLRKTIEMLRIDLNSQVIKVMSYCMHVIMVEKFLAQTTTLCL